AAICSYRAFVSIARNVWRAPVRAGGLPERLREAAPAQSDERDDHGAAAAGAGTGGALRESAAAVVQAADGGSGPALARAVPARAGPRGLRSGPAGVAGGGRAAVGGVDCAAEGQLAGGVRDVEAPAAGRPGARVRLGRRHLRQGGVGEGQGGDARADRGIARWAEGHPRGGERVSGVDGELGGAAAGPQGARVAGGAAGDRRWASGDLGGGGDRVPGGRRAALLESPDRQRARHAAPEAAERGAGPADEDSLRGDAGGGGAAEGRVPGL